MAARAQIAEAQRPEGDASQLAHGMADRVAHPPHLALAALAQHELEPVAPAGARLGRRGAAVVELDAPRAGPAARARPTGPRSTLAR